MNRRTGPGDRKVNLSFRGLDRSVLGLRVESFQLLCDAGGRKRELVLMAGTLIVLAGRTLLTSGASGWT